MLSSQPRQTLIHLLRNKLLALITLTMSVSETKRLFLLYHTPFPNLSNSTVSAFVSSPSYKVFQISHSAHPPAVKDYQEKVHTQEGQEVTLQVKVTGLPLPTVTWFQGGRKVESDYSTEVRDDGSLTFACVEPKHAGTYHFSASNSEGSVEGNTKLIVHADDDDAEEGGSAPKLESNPVQVEVFGEYVAGLHANSNAGFIVQYQVSQHDIQQVTVIAVVSITDPPIGRG